MAIVLDETTRAEYLALTLASSRASVVVSALGSTVYCEVYDGTNVLRATGTMASPWATASGATITIGEVDAAGLVVSSGGAPDSNWYCQFRSSSGRFVRGTFGVSTDTGADFRWNQSTFQTGSKGTLGTVTLTADGVTGVAPVNTALPVLSGSAQVGLSLSSSTGTWANTPTSYSYQWQRSSTGASGWANISGATSSTYTLTSTDLGQYVRVSVTASNDYGSGSAFSAASAAVTAAPTTGTITTFQVTSATTGSSLPWAFGHAFKQGDVPAGTDVVGDSIDFQATPTTTWPDGSVRHAIIAGRTTFSSAGTVTVTLSRGTASNATALSIADLKAAMPASTTVVVGGTTMTLAGTFLDSPHRTVCAGAVMSNWIYRLPVSGNPHLVIWCDVRLYKGGTVEIFPWVENGFINSTGLTNHVVQCDVVVGGVTKFSQSLDIKYASRVALVSGSTFSHWTSDPQIVPKHDMAYLKSTKLVPNYGYGLPSETRLAALGQTYTPTIIDGAGGNMGSAGGHGNIIPDAHALYITSNGDARAWRCMMADALTGGKWPVHFRDPNTNAPIRAIDWPTVNAPSGSGGTYGTPAVTHQPSFGYLPFLATGRLWFWESSAFWATYAYASMTVAYRLNSDGIIDTGAYTPRGAAWSLRCVSEMLALAPSTHPILSDWARVWANNMAWYRAAYVDGTSYGTTTFGSANVSPQGFLGDYSSNAQSLYPTATSGAYFMGSAAWQGAYFQQALGHASNLGLPVSSQAALDLIAVRNHAYKQVVQRASGDGLNGNYNWRNFVVFGYPIGSPSSIPISSWFTIQQSWAAAKVAWQIGDVPATRGLALFDHSRQDTTINSSSSSLAYGSHQLSALAMAVDHGIPNADTGWLNVSSASNWSALTDHMKENPAHGFAPRNAVGLPSWVPAQGTFANISLNTVAQVAPSDWPKSADLSGPFALWSGGAYVRDYGRYGAYVARGSGHVQGSNNFAGVWVFDLETRQWAGRNVPSQALFEVADAQAASYWNVYGESIIAATVGHPYAPHTYQSLVGMPAALGGGTNGSLLQIAAVVSATDYRPVHKFDLSSATAAPARVINDMGWSAGIQPQYNASVLDEARGGVWSMPMGGTGPVKFIKFSDWSITSYNISFGCLSYAMLCYVPAPYDALFSICNQGPYGDPANQYREMRVSRIVNGVPQPWQTLTMAGTIPANAENGLVYSTLLNAFVSYEGRQSYRVHKCPLPAVADIATATYTWTTETLTGVSGAVPSYWTNTSGAVSENGTFGRFMEVPALRCFIFCNSNSRPVQAWRLTGM